MPVILLFFLSTTVFASNWVLNNPYPQEERDQSIYYSSFFEQPKTLDPARSYSSNEYLFLGQIYEPLLQYDYLKRPYELKPLTASQWPEIRYLNKDGQMVKAEDPTIAYSIYRIHLKKNIFYQPHPAFAKNSQGNYQYLNLPENYLAKHSISKLADFPQTGTRELLADDYIYEIKRLANPKVSSPLYGLMSEYILGFKEYGSTLPKVGEESYIDLRNFPLEGLRKIDDYTFEIKLKGQYTQFIFWLAMPFFAPLPWEADKFYSQEEMDDKNITLDWYPIGTGPFMLSENNPNSQMVLTKNPNYRAEYFPLDGSEEDKKIGYLKHAGERLPLVNQVVFTLEKESIPRWNKFLQGYYDASGISADSYDQAIQINRKGEPVLSSALQAKKMHLTQTIEPSVFYMGFNMLDSVVGGKSERARKLRQAISIAVNYDENIAIFLNGRGKPAQGPIPPGIFGYKEGKEGINPYVFQWSNGSMERRPIAQARQLMTKAGYPNGRDPKTGKALILHYDVPATGGPDDKAQLDWMRKQFAEIGIELNVRSTQYNRFQEKMRAGNAQIFSWGWNADYPDPENFLFLLYGPNGKVTYGGENAGNYANPVFDKWFEAMKNRPNDAQRQKIIDRMIALVRYEAPWVWGINGENFAITQQWVSLVKPNTIAQNTLKYAAVNVDLRNQMRQQWNQPILWPFAIVLAVLLGLVIPLWLSYRKKQQRAAIRVSL